MKLHGSNIALNLIMNSNILDRSQKNTVVFEHLVIINKN